MKREKKHVKPKAVSSADWRKGEVARWTLASLSNDASDTTFAIAFLQAWAERTCEVGVLRSRARCAPTDEGVRLLWVSRGPGYLSQAEERRLEAAFDKLTPEKREVERALGDPRERLLEEQASRADESNPSKAMHIRHPRAPNVGPRARPRAASWLI